MRSYGTEPQIWDGDPNCQHEWGVVHPPGYRSSDTKPGPLQSEGNTNRQNLKSDVCIRCGAWRGELGSEPSPELFVKHITTICHELKRVLRNDGVFWYNIGDSYARNPQKGGSGTPTDKNNRGEKYQGSGISSDLKEKDLIGIPYMVAFSLRADGAASPQTMYTVERIRSALLNDYDTWNDVPKNTKRTIEDLDEEWMKAHKGGWYLRADLPWVKRNSLPSSVTDRPSSSIEHVFLFSKSGDTKFWTHPTKCGTRNQPEPDYVYTNKATGEITQTPPQDWKDIMYVKEGETKESNLWKRRNLWDGHDYFYDHVATMQPSSESYNKDKRPRGKLRQTVNPNSKYPDEGQFKKQDGTGNPTVTGFNARYEDNGTGLRFMRDSDFFFKTWQGLLHNEDGEPMSLVVNPRGYKGAHFACVDTETECLTIGGWKRYDQISEGTPIFTYNMKKSCLEIQPVKDIISYRYSGNLISVFGRSSNMLMTPDHRCVVTTRDKKINGGRHPAKIIEASKLKGGMKFIVSSHLDFDPIVPNDPKEYYELMGWVLSEGHFKDSGGISISQSISKNPHKCKRIQYLLEFLKVDFNTWSRKRPYKDVISEEREWSISGEYRRKIRHMIPDKYRIPEHFVMLPDEYIESFLNGFIGGDGHVRSDSRISITQKEKQPLDIIQAMFLRMNTSCILSQKGNNMWSAFITNNKKDRCFKNSSSSLVKNDYAYDGTVWCPHVDNGTWVARRGGRPFITGNCFPVQLVEPLVLSGTSDHGVCPHCGSPWARNIKKTSTTAHDGKTDCDYEVGSAANRLALLRQRARENGEEYSTVIQTTGWSPSCSCKDNIPIPAIVIDPFGGSSATGVACKLHNRSYIGIELNPEYCKLGEQRVRDGK